MDIGAVVQDVYDNGWAGSLWFRGALLGAGDRIR